MACGTLNGDDAVIVERIRGTDAPFYRPPLLEQQSKSVHPGILTLMKQCWVEEPSERPSFSDVAKCLKTINKGKSVDLALSYFVYSLKRFRPHRQYCVDAAYCYRRGSVVRRSVCLSVGLSVVIVNHAKTAEPIEMPFGCWTRVGPRKHGLEFRRGRGAHWRQLAYTIEPFVCGGDAM